MAHTTTLATVDRLAELAQAGRLSRRELLRRAAALGLAPPVVAALLTACGGSAPATATTTGGPAPTTAPMTTSGVTQAASAAASTAPAASRGGTFTLARPTVDPASLDPHLIRETSEKEISYSIYEPLVAFTPGSNDLEPRLATSWEVSPDGLSYVFKLRDGVKFQDGSPFNAECVKYSLDRLLGIGKGPSFVLQGVYDRTDVVDPLTARVVLKSPSAPFLISTPLMMMVGATVKDHATAEDKWAEKWLAQPANMNGTGPFKMAKLDRGKEVVLEKNPNHWGIADRPRVDKFVIIEVKEPSTQRQMLVKGDIQAMIPVPDDVKALQNERNVRVELGDSIQMLYIQVSQVVPPLDNPKVRQAISLAFDYEPFITGVYNNLAEQAQGPIAKLIPYHDKSIPMPKRDLNRAKQLLAEAGFPNGGFELEFVQNQGNAVQLGAALILQEGLKALGVGLKIVELSWPVMVQRMQNKDNLMQLFGYFRNPDFPDPDAYFFGLWHTSNQLKGFNGTLYGNAETDRLIQTGRTEVDSKKRAEIYSQLQRQLFDDAAAIFLAIPKQVVALSPKVEGFKFTPTIPSRFNTDTIGLRN